jgi:uncharacterized protein (TIGR03435 family)
MKMLADSLASLMGRFVQDETGLEGAFNFYDRVFGGFDRLRVRWKWRRFAGDSGRPSIFTALTEQVGLKLEPKKGPVPIFVV